MRPALPPIQVPPAVRDALRAVDLLAPALVAGVLVFLAGVWMVFPPAAVMLAGLSIVALAVGAMRGKESS